MAKIVYVDEQEDQRDQMVASIKLSGLFDDDDVVPLDPLPDIDEMVDEISSHHPDVLITDFRLNEYKAGIGYDGTQLVSRYLRLNKSFPCFVTTGFAPEAANAATPDIDVNSIFAKSASFAPDGKDVPFFLRVQRKISSRKKLIENYENKISELQGKLKDKPLSPEEAKLLFSLDAELESMLGGAHHIPGSVKELALEPLTSLIGKADKIISELEKAFPEKKA